MLNKTTEKNFIEKLERAGINWYMSGRNIMICCPFHGESVPSLGADFSKGVFNCFSCGESGRIWYLVKKLFEDDDEEELTLQEIDEKVDDSSGDLERIKQLLSKASEKEIDIEKIKILTNFNPDKFVYPKGDYAEYLESRNIDKEMWNEFGMRAGYYKGDKRILVPMEDEYGRLVAIMGRSITTNDKTFKVRKSKDSDVGKILFNLKRAKFFKSCILVEGEMDAIYLWQFEIPAVSIGTKKLTEWQLYKLASYFNKVFLALDGEVKKDDYTPIMRMISEYVEVERIQLPDKKDPNNLTKDEVEEIFFKYRGEWNV